MDISNSNFDKLKPIDWGLCLELANNAPAFAAEMLSMLVDDLTPSRDKIMAAFKQENWQDLQHHIHRLHGACCYCGVPKLKQLARETETALKQENLEKVKKLVPYVDAAITEILTAYAANNYQ